ncbi:MAG: transposase [Clostridiales bacterium]|jgi:transposase|nr:transposase [Clostridiales bacterium]
MAYSIDLRSRVIKYIQKGHTQEETSIVFSVGISTIKRWLSLLSETGGLNKRPLKRSASIFESEKLKAYIDKNPDALLKDIADHFGGSVTGAFYALERERITLKKKNLITKKEMKTNAMNLKKN